MSGQTVWVFTLGSYSDETVETVYASKELADKALEIANKAGDGAVYEVVVTDELPSVRYEAYLTIYSDPKLMEQRSRGLFGRHDPSEPYVYCNVVFGKNEFESSERYCDGSNSWDKGECWNYTAKGPDRERCIKSVVDRAIERVAVLAGVA